MAALPPPLPVELVEEILLRLPPDEPAWLLRASLVCKAWAHAVSHRSFRRRLHELHRTAPVLGFFRNSYRDDVSQFIPTTASSFSLAAPEHRPWRALDCRHGRALFISGNKLLVWEPIDHGRRAARTGARTVREKLPELKTAVPWRGRGLRRGWVRSPRLPPRGPFRLVFVFGVGVRFPYDTYACLYSSETGTWGESTSLQSVITMDFSDHSSVLVGRSLLYFMSTNTFIVQYDSTTHGLTLLALHIEVGGQAISDPPPVPFGFNLVLLEDGGLGVIHDIGDHLKLWALEASDGPDEIWVLRRVINMRQILAGEFIRACVLGFAEGANVIFVDTGVGLFTVELQSERVRKVRDAGGISSFVPVVSFYTPMHKDKHQDPPPSSPSEKAGGEEEKTVDQAQQLFEEVTNAIKEGEFLNACFSRTLDIRVPSYKEVALECASMEYGCALLQKPQEVDDPLDDVPKSVPNEESVTGSANKDDSGN